ncbi:hypothetical protein [Sphingomicrobium arenosum]|nr:hypothetical protein [Sphingomicrobium arenosum]
MKTTVKAPWKAPRLDRLPAKHARMSGTSICEGQDTRRGSSMNCS